MTRAHLASIRRPIYKSSGTRVADPRVLLTSIAPLVQYTRRKIVVTPKLFGGDCQKRDTGRDVAELIDAKTALTCTAISRTVTTTEIDPASASRSPRTMLTREQQ
jgi:hypothetical protein